MLRTFYAIARRFARAAILAFAFAGAAHAADRPNVVLILADDLGFSDTSPYGSEIDTPNIARLAAEGVRLSNYHTAASCAPTRGMLLTGVDSHRNGVPNIVEAIPPEQAEYPNYRGELSENVATIAELLRDSGYHTYMAGKWHLGHKRPELRPSARGFERTVAMADTGADNWESKPYLPIYERANWYADGERFELPDDFYSSKFFIDKTIEFIESGKDDGKPFFAYIPFQAVHIPVQAPREYTEKYLGRYDEGWHALREARLAAAIDAGVVPKDTVLAPVSSTKDWNALDADQKRYASKTMAVYAGMVDAMDHHIGRLMRYLEEAGEYENTVFIVTSDNGAEGTDVTAIPGGELLSGLMLWHLDYSDDYETLGEKGSFVTIGPSFASAASAPLAYYKFFAHDGGMRVPFIAAGPGVARSESAEDAFAYVTDVAPTILDLVDVARPGGRYGDRDIEAMTGTSMAALLAGRVETLHAPDESIGYELAGNAALFRGDYKLVRDRGPIGDGEWHLYNLAADVGEARDLRDEMPELFDAMKAEYAKYEADFNVAPVPEGYDQRTTVMRKGLRERFGRQFLLVLAVLLAVSVLLVRRARSRSQRA